MRFFFWENVGTGPMLPEPREECTEGKHWEGHKQRMEQHALGTDQPRELTEKHLGEAQLQTPLVLIFLFMLDLSLLQQKTALMLRIKYHELPLLLNNSYDF